MLGVHLYKCLSDTAVHCVYICRVCSERVVDGDHLQTQCLHLLCGRAQVSSIQGVYKVRAYGVPDPGAVVQLTQLLEHYLLNTTGPDTDGTLVVLTDI